MYQTKNTIPEKIRLQVIGQLQTHLASSLDLTTQAKQAHWNVKGPDFIALHGLFDKIAEDSENYVDLIAERIMQLGGSVEGTLRISAKRSELAEYPMNISTGLQHVNALAYSLATYGECIRTAIGKIEELSDPATLDILIEISREVDKNLWFIEAHLQADR